MKPEKSAQHGDKAERIADKPYQITVNDTVVRIRFSGDKGINACLANALNRMNG